MAADNDAVLIDDDRDAEAEFFDGRGDLINRALGYFPAVAGVRGKLFDRPILDA